MKRKSLSCMGSDTSPISSRNRVPVSASSARPILRFTAPVKDPFSCPKSSLSISPSGIAAQFTEMKGLSARSEFFCMDFATSSLPVPDSPRIRTVAFDSATFEIIA